MSNKEHTFIAAHAAMLLVAIIYGINYFIIKDFILSAGLHPMAVLAIRSIGATLFFILFYLIALRKPIPKGKDLGRLFLCAVFGISLNQIFFLKGLSETSEVNASVLMITTPLFVFLLASILKQEKVTMMKITGLFLSFFSAIVLIGQNKSGAFDYSPDNIDGDIMVTFNAACYGVYLVLVRPLVQKYDTFTIVAGLFAIGGFINIIAGWDAFIQTDPEMITNRAIWGLAYLIGASTITVYFLNAWAMRKVQSSAVGMYIYVQPVFVTIFSVVLAKGDLNWIKMLCIFFIFMGVYLVTMKGRTVINRK